MFFCRLVFGCIGGKYEVFGKEEPKDEVVYEPVKYNIYSKEYKVICSNIRHGGNYVVHKDKAYYTSGRSLFEVEISTALPHITNDGRYVSVHNSTANDFSTHKVIDTSTAEEKAKFKKYFSEPFNVSNHTMICPTNPNLFFCS